MIKQVKIIKHIEKKNGRVRLIVISNSKLTFKDKKDIFESLNHKRSLF